MTNGWLNTPQHASKAMLLPGMQNSRMKSGRAGRNFELPLSVNTRLRPKKGALHGPAHQTLATLLRLLLLPDLYLQTRISLSRL